MIVLIVVQLQMRVVLASSGGTSGGLLAPVTPTLRAQVADPLASAFAHTLAWTVAIGAAALIPVLLVAVRRFRAAQVARTRIRGRALLT